MKGALPFLAPLALFPLLGLGLWLWKDQGAYVWLSDFVMACF